MIQYKLFTGNVFDNEVDYKKELDIWRNRKIDDIPSKFFNCYMKEFHSELINNFELNFDKRQGDIEVTLIHPIQIIAKNKFINEIKSYIGTKILVNSNIGIEDLAYVIKNMEDIITEKNNIYSDSKETDKND
jgi:hypothetical protein